LRHRYSIPRRGRCHTSEIPHHRTSSNGVNPSTCHGTPPTIADEADANTVISQFAALLPQATPPSPHPETPTPDSLTSGARIREIPYAADLPNAASLRVVAIDISYVDASSTQVDEVTAGIESQHCAQVVRPLLACHHGSPDRRRWIVSADQRCRILPACRSRRRRPSVGF